MAVAFQTKSETVASTANASVTEPSGTTTNDFLLGLFVIENNATAFTAPASWTQLFTGSSTGSGAGSFGYWLGWIVRGGSAPSYAFTHAAIYREWHVLRFNGNDAASPIDSSANVASSTLNPYNPDPPSTTAVDSAALAVAGGVGWAGSSAGWAHAVYTMRTRNTAGDDAMMATRQLAASGAENPAAFSGATAGSVPGWAFTLTIKPAGAGGAVTVKQLAALGVG
jgi:hypothetical protein